MFISEIIFFIMTYKYTFNTHTQQLTNNKKSTIIKLEHTKTRSIQNGVMVYAWWN